MKRIQLVLILFLITTFYFAGQSQGYIKGYVIPHQGDTIFGKFLRQSDIKACKKAILIDSLGKQIKYTIQKAKAYKIGNDHYVKKTFRGSSLHDITRFAKIILNGKVILYEAHYSSSQPVYGGGSLNSECRAYLVQNDASYKKVKGGRKFRKEMPDFFSDNEELSLRIKNEELEYRDIVRIVRMYNLEWEMSQANKEK